jgi:hypothetical protein
MIFRMRYAGVLFALLSSGFLFGQAETTIITESSDPLEDIYVDDVVQKRLIYETKVLPYEWVREADIPWERRIWRVIDIREKLNLPFAYPEKPFFTLLADAAESGEIKVFQDDKFREMLTPDEVGSQLVYMDTSIVYDPETYEEKVEITRSEKTPGHSSTKPLCSGSIIPKRVKYWHATACSMSSMTPRWSRGTTCSKCGNSQAIFSNSPTYRICDLSICIQTMELPA